MQASDSNGSESEPPCSEEGRGLRGDGPCPCPTNARPPRVMGLADQKGEAGFGSEFPAIDVDGASLETGATGSTRVCREGLGRKASSGQEDDTAQEPGQCDGLSAAAVAAKATAAAAASSLAAAAAAAAAAVAAVARAASKLEDTVVAPRAAAPSDPSPPSPALAATTELPPTPQAATPPPPPAGPVPQPQAPAGRQPANLGSVSSSEPASAKPSLPSSHPPYLAAGVLPFCVLGGDLLFLLGQQLRFRSRVRRPSLSELRGVSTSVGGGCGAGVGGSGARVIGVVSPAAPSCNSNSRDGASADGGEPRRETSNAAEMLAEAPDATDGAVGCATVGQPLPSGEVEEGQGQGTVPAGLLWSDFGGAREAGDADAKETASREFAEESFGMFHDVRLESDSVSRSQAAMEATLRDTSLKGKRVFECRNGGYVMFIAEVDFVPDLMMKLARKDIVEGGRGGGGGDGDGDDDPDNDVGVASTAFGLGGQGRASPPGFSEKTDFAWVPASTLLGAMRDSRHRSTRKVVLKLGGCRYLRLFHKFVISLWGLDLAAVIKAVSTPLHRRKRPLPAPRALLLKPGASHRSTRRPSGRGSSKGSGGGGGGGGGGGRGGGGSGGGRGDNSSGHGDSRAESSSRAGGVTNQVGGGRSAIRGIDCIRPSFLSGRKRSSLGIIDEHCYRQGPSAQREDGGVGEDGSDGAAGSAADSEPEGAAGIEAGADVGSDGLEARGREWSVGGGAGRKSRGKKSGAACRKRRRQCKEARRLKAETAAAAAAAVVVAAAAASAAVAAEAAAVALATRQAAAVGAL